ncbi:MAG: tetratricopeptide repeat protein [Spirochaetia bacterium]|nr:tetratricopeptide repeat protein [Spirochaetia bacterium]
MLKLLNSPINKFVLIILFNIHTIFSEEISTAYLNSKLSGKNGSSAIEYLNDLNSKYPENPHILFKMGYYYMTHLTNDKEAEKYYQECLSFNPSYSEALVNLGIIYKNKNDYKNAEQYYKKAIEKNANSSSAYYNLGILYLSLERVSEAEKSFDRAINLSPDNISAHLNIAAVYINLFNKDFMKRNLTNAKKHLIKANHIDNKYPHVYYNLAYLYEKENKPDIALKFYKEAVRYYENTDPQKKTALERIEYLTSVVKH